MTLKTVFDGADVAIMFPNDTAEAARQAALALVQANAAALSAQAALAAPRYYATIAAGVAATTSGQMFTSDEGGTWNYYLRTGTTPFYSLFRGVVAADVNGNLPLGAGSADAKLVVQDAGAGQITLKDSAGTTRAYVTTSAAIGSAPSNALRLRGDAGIAMGAAGSIAILIDSSNNVRPGVDNATPLGTASFRWSVIYAATGTINTSDARDKTWRSGLTSAELLAAKRIAGELGFYQWNDAIAEKGPDEARYHFGVRAQAVWQIMAEEGLVDPIGQDGKPGEAPYAFLCFDEWAAQPARAEVLDESGEVIEPALPAVPAGTRFGLRIDQLALFLIAAQEQRLAALEAA